MPFGLVAVVILAWLLLMIRWEKCMVRRLEAADCRLCPRCSYPLAGHTGNVSCPECGTSCNVEEVQRAWRGFRPRISGVFRS